MIGAIPLDRLVAACLVGLCYGAFCLVVALRHRGRTRALGGPIAGGSVPMIVAHASQTGTAEALAQETAAALRKGGIPVQVASLGSLDDAALNEAGRALFVVSTTGEGDAPDEAGRFVHGVLSSPARLDGLRYGLLALGDHGYANFCGFGRALDQGLVLQGATPLFERVEVDGEDEAALRLWQARVRDATVPELPAWTRSPETAWTLIERRCLNPGGPGGAAFLIALAPRSGSVPEWQAGDIAEIRPRDPSAVSQALARPGLDAPARTLIEGRSPNLGERFSPGVLTADAAPHNGAAVLVPLAHRDYSIASLPADGRLELVVRLVSHPDGRLGTCSGWLAVHAPIGGPIELRIRANTAFHAPAAGRPLVLIGNGTGIAGLRAHLKARAAEGHGETWLLFGERRRGDAIHFPDELAQWQGTGGLTRVDLAFSRDGQAPMYVQDLLRAAASDVRRWVDRGAAIYVCGSAATMAPAVDAALAGALGDAALAALREDNRYRRDVY